EIIHPYEQPQARIAREGAGKTRIVTATGRERTHAAARQIKDSVGVAVVGQFLPQIMVIGVQESVGERDQVEIDRHGRCSKPAAASSTARPRDKSGYPRIRIRESALLLAEKLCVETIQRNAQVIAHEECFGE